MPDNERPTDEASVRIEELILDSNEPVIGINEQIRMIARAAFMNHK
jgi:hypothetical protein